MNKKPKQALTEKFLAAWKEYSGCPDHEPESELRFHPERKWRFDFAFPDHMVAVELVLPTPLVLDLLLFTIGGRSRHRETHNNMGHQDKYALQGTSQRPTGASRAAGAA